jgi:hypothetical protein
VLSTRDLAPIDPTPVPLCLAVVVVVVVVVGKRGDYWLPAREGSSLLILILTRRV